MPGDALTGVVCDDAPGFRVLLSALLGDHGVSVTGVGESWADAERMATGVDVVVVDLWMPEYEHDCLARIRSGLPGATLAVVTALDLSSAAEKLTPIEVDLLLSKTSPPTEVAATIAKHAAARAAG